MKDLFDELDAAYAEQGVPVGKHLPTFAEQQRADLSIPERLAGNAYNAGQGFYSGVMDVVAGVPEMLGQVVEMGTGDGAPDPLELKIAKRRQELGMDLSEADNAALNWKPNILRRGAESMRDLVSFDERMLGADGKPLVSQGLGTSVFQGAGSALGFMALGAGVTGLAEKLGVAMTAGGQLNTIGALGSVVEAQSLYREAEAAGASKEQKVGAFTTGLVAGYTERFGAATILSRLDTKLGGSLFKSLLAPELTAKVLLEGGEEGGQEMLQNVIEEASRKYLTKYGEDKDWNEIMRAALVENALPAFLVGGILGGAAHFDERSAHKTAVKKVVGELAGEDLSTAANFNDPYVQGELAKKAEARPVATEEQAVEAFKADNAKVLEARAAEAEPEEQAQIEEHKKALDAAEVHTLGDESNGRELSADEAQLHGVVKLLRESGAEIPDVLVVDSGAKLPIQGASIGGKIIIDGARTGDIAKGIVFHEAFHHVVPRGSQAFKDLAGQARESFPVLAEALRQVYLKRHADAAGELLPGVTDPEQRAAAEFEEAFALGAELMPNLVEAVLIGRDLDLTELQKDRGLMGKIRDFLVWALRKATLGKIQLEGTTRTELERRIRELSKLDGKDIIGDDHAAPEEKLAFAEALTAAYKSGGKEMLSRAVEQANAQRGASQEAQEPVSLAPEDLELITGIDMAAEERAAAAEPVKKRTPRAAKPEAAQQPKEVVKSKSTESPELKKLQKEAKALRRREANARKYGNDEKANELGRKAAAIERQVQELEGVAPPSAPEQGGPVETHKPRRKPKAKPAPEVSDRFKELREEIQKLKARAARALGRGQKERARELELKVEALEEKLAARENGPEQPERVASIEPEKVVSPEPKVDKAAAVKAQGPTKKLKGEELEDQVRVDTRRVGWSRLHLIRRVTSRIRAGAVTFPVTSGAVEMAIDGGPNDDLRQEVLEAIAESVNTHAEFPDVFGKAAPTPTVAEMPRTKPDMFGQTEERTLKRTEVGGDKAEQHAMFQEDTGAKGQTSLLDEQFQEPEAEPEPEAEKPKAPLTDAQKRANRRKKAQDAHAAKMDAVLSDPNSTFVHWARANGGIQNDDGDLTEYTKKENPEMGKGLPPGFPPLVRAKGKGVAPDMLIRDMHEAGWFLTAPGEDVRDLEGRLFEDENPVDTVRRFIDENPTRAEIAGEFEQPLEGADQDQAQRDEAIQELADEMGWTFEEAKQVFESKFSVAPREDTPEFKAMVARMAPELKNEDGTPKVFYHGARRPDRVGSRFRKSRATAGPMPYFTDSPSLASSYAMDKEDTSLETPDDYSGWFKYKPKGSRSTVTIDRAWYTLSQAEREMVLSRFNRVTVQDNETSENIPVETLPEGETAVAGKSHWDYVLVVESKGNPLRAMVDVWLNSGTLFGDEARFMDLLREAGVDPSRTEFDSPHLDRAGVFAVYLDSSNPLNVKDIPTEIVLSLRKASKRKRGKSGLGELGWDKAYVSGPQWISRLEDDLDEGTTFAWTVIPDWVTKALREAGYDGVLDVSGKNGGDENAVFIPFTDNQVKSIWNRRPTSDPDIRRSVAYHGSPHDIEEGFSLQKIGSGEGNQAFGWGLYFSDSKGVAKHYKKVLTRKAPKTWIKSRFLLGPKEVRPSSVAEEYAWKALHEASLMYHAGPALEDFAIRLVRAVGTPPADRSRAREIVRNHKGRIPKMVKRKGHGYTVELAPDEDEYLLWDKPLSEQSEKVRGALAGLGYDVESDKTLDGADVYKQAARGFGGPRGQRARLASIKLREAGIRGIKYLDGMSRKAGEGTYNYVIFDDADVQITGRWSVAPSDPNETINLDMTWGSHVESMLADNLIHLRNLQEKLVVPEGGNFDQEEVRSWGILGEQVNKFQEGFVQPLVDAMKEGDISVDEAHLYLAALTSLERTKTLMERDAKFREKLAEWNESKQAHADWKRKKSKWDKWNEDKADGKNLRRERPGKPGKAPKVLPKPKGEDRGTSEELNPGGWLRESEAKAIIASARDGGKGKAFRKIRQLNRAMHAAKLEVIKKAGLEPKEVIDAIEGMGWKDYSPMKTVWKGRVGIGRSKGFSVNGKTIGRMGGRRTEPDNVLVTGVSDFIAVLQRAEKNRLVNVFSRLVRANPDPKLWEIVDGTLSSVSMTSEDAINAGEEPNIYRALWDARIPKGAASVGFMDGGVQKYIVFHPRAKHLAEALDGSNLKSFGDVLGPFSKINRYYAAANTSFSLNFVIDNFRRDSLLAGIRIAVDESPADAAKILAATPGAVMEIMRGRDKASEKLMAYYEAGAKTGFFYGGDLEHTRKGIQKQLKRAQAATGPIDRTARAFSAFAGMVHHVNDAVENGVRYAYWTHLVENGMSHEEAAVKAKELTINFNKKGRIAPLLGPFYLFFNASMRGSVVVKDMVKEHPVKVVGGLFTAGVLLDSLNYLLAGDDDDGVNSWDARPEYEKDRYIMLPDGNGGFFRLWSMPYGLNAIVSAGRHFAAMLRGGESKADSVAGTLASALDAFNPLGGGGGDPTNAVGHMVSPTFFDPMMDIIANDNFAGHPVYPGYESKEPDAFTSWPSTGPFWKEAAQALNSITGGDRLESGFIDAHPETLRHLWKQIGGGVWRDATHMTDAINSLSEGEFVQAIDFAPITSKFHSSEFEGQWRSAYYENTAAITSAMDRFKSLNGPDPDGLRKMNAEEKALYQLDGQRKSITSYVKKMNGAITVAGGTKEAETLHLELVKTVREFNREVSRARKEAKEK